MVRHAANDATFFDVVLSKRLYAPPFRGIAVPACKKTVCQQTIATLAHTRQPDTPGSRKGGGTGAGCTGGEVFVYGRVGGQGSNLAIDAFEKVENKSNGYQT